MAKCLGPAPDENFILIESPIISFLLYLSSVETQTSFVPKSTESNSLELGKK